MKTTAGAQVIVEGKVQGVGFRAFVHFHAMNLGLNGWVQNCSDGSVQAQVEGARENIEAFVEKVRQGPPFSRVDSVMVDWREPNRQTEGFRILK